MEKIIDLNEYHLTKARKSWAKLNRKGGVGEFSLAELEDLEFILEDSNPILSKKLKKMASKLKRGHRWWYRFASQ